MSVSYINTEIHRLKHHITDHYATAGNEYLSHRHIFTV